MPQLPLSFAGGDITITARFLNVFEYDLPLVQAIGFTEHLLERPDLPRIEGEVRELLTGHQNLILRALIRKYGHVCDLLLSGRSSDTDQPVVMFTLTGCVFREMKLGVATDDLCVDATYPFTAAALIEHGRDPDWAPIPARPPVVSEPGDPEPVRPAIFQS